MPAGRTYLQSLYRLTRDNNGEKAKAGHHRRLNAETIGDLKMFKEFLQQSADAFAVSIPFLNKLKLNASDLGLYADAAGGKELGAGIFFRNCWRQILWRDTKLFENEYKPNIALLELYAIVLALDVWAPGLSSKINHSQNRQHGHMFLY